MGRYKISVDTGGAFTDVIVAAAGRALHIDKIVPHGTTPVETVTNALGAICRSMDIPLTTLLRDAEYLIYGTSLAQTAIIDRTAAKTAFVTTEGFPEILRLREGGKRDPFDFSEPFPEPFIPRRHTFEVGGRISAEGDELVPLDSYGARILTRTLRDRGFEAVAVCLLWSTADPSHERRFGEIMKELAPDLPYTLSHELLPIVREYRRASATALDASLKPVMRRHLLALEDELRACGFAGRLLVSSVAGGCLPVQAAIDRPIYTIRSSAAMAPIAGCALAAAEGVRRDVIVCDLGSRSLDVGLVKDGRVVVSRDMWVGAPNSGELLGISAVDVRSVPLGTGSIAWIDDGGLLRVGPHSAGSDPGPVCYGRGGLEPTVFDAAAVLNYLPPDTLLGGKLVLDEQAAREAVARLAEQLGENAEATALRIVRLACNQMACAIHDIVVSHGIDPRETAIVAGGGAIGLYIMAIAEEIGCATVIVPRVASALSAAGMQAADIVAEEAASLLMRTDDFDLVAANALLAELHARLSTYATVLPGYDIGAARVEYSVEARYAGQVWELETPLPEVPLSNEQSVAMLAASFHDVHERSFAIRDEGGAIELVNWKARLVVPLSSGDEMATVDAGEACALVGSAQVRLCRFEPGSLSSAVYRADDLLPGESINGPSIVEGATMTLVVPPTGRVTVTHAGNFLLDPTGRLKDD